MTPFALPLLLWTALMGRDLWLRPRGWALAGALPAGVGVAALSWAAGLALGHLTGFGLMTLLCWLLFVAWPVLAAVVAWRGRGRVRGVAALVAAALVAVGIDAFLVEPNSLELRQVQVEVEGLEAPVRIALVADVQTDRVGAFEARAFALAAAAQPDLVLFTGDHVQLRDGPEFRAQAERHAAALRDSGLDAPLGMFAVRGDIDPDTWPAVFAGTGVRVVEESSRFDLGPLTLTALDPRDSRTPSPPVRPAAGPHVVMGHSPDFALSQPPADLLLAGHTHGGQVVLPFFGPPLTFAAVPRDWAAGHTALPWGGHLVVSRGVGMERMDAPRLRFNCRPELVVVDLVPAGQGDTGPAVADPS